MAEVDPFIQPIPSQWARDRELRSYIEYLHRFLHDIWVRTGAGDDDIARVGSKSDRVYSGLINELLSNVEIGDSVTVDDTGFRADSTRLYTDITVS